MTMSRRDTAAAGVQSRSVNLALVTAEGFALVQHHVVDYSGDYRF